MKQHEEYIINEVFRDYGDRTDVLIILQDRLASFNRTIKVPNVESTKLNN
tara:strand:+ start:311 stop:460 length:150 start_codon:yes stop_codon:yes gene_type:complete